MENEIVEALNRNTAILHHLVGLITDLTKKKTIEQDWYDANDTLRILKISKRSLYRMRHSYPDQCRKLMGKWYYNLTVLMIHQSFDQKLLLQKNTEYFF